MSLLRAERDRLRAAVIELLKRGTFPMNVMEECAYCYVPGEVATESHLPTCPWRLAVEKANAALEPAQ